MKEELDEIVSAWNSHRIRPTHNPRAPSGRPSIMFAVPSLYLVMSDDVYEITDLYLQLRELILQGLDAED